MTKKTKREYHYVVVHDTETNKWYVASAGDFLPEGVIWDKEECDWVDWDESYSDGGYDEKYKFLEETLRDFNIFSDTYRSLDEESKV